MTHTFSLKACPFCKDSLKFSEQFKIFLGVTFQFLTPIFVYFLLRVIQKNLPDLNKNKGIEPNVLGF